MSRSSVRVLRKRALCKVRRGIAARRLDWAFAGMQTALVDALVFGHRAALAGMFGNLRQQMRELVIRPFVRKLVAEANPNLVNQHGAADDAP